MRKDEIMDSITGGEAATSFDETSKPFWASHTIWSSVAVIGAAVTGGVLALRSGDMGAFSAALTAALGGICAIIGRFRATTAIR
jgi:hypothetical protein